MALIISRRLAKDWKWKGKKKKSATVANVFVVLYKVVILIFVNY